MFVKNGTTMSGLVGTGNNFWAGMYFAASTLGFVLAYALAQAYYVRRLNVFAWWHLGLVFVLCMAAGVALPGGLVVLLWHLSEKRKAEDDRWDAAAAAVPRAQDGEEEAEQTTNGADAADGGVSLAAVKTTRYGCRPQFEGTPPRTTPHQCRDANAGALRCGRPGRDVLNKPDLRLFSFSFCVQRSSRRSRRRPAAARRTWACWCAGCRGCRRAWRGVQVAQPRPPRREAPPRRRRLPFQQPQLRPVVCRPELVRHSAQVANILIFN